MRAFREYDPSQSFLLPENPREWLPRDHIVFFIEETVGKLDLSEIVQTYESDKGGAPPFVPRMMVSVLFYAYMEGNRSSRAIERLLVQDVSYRVLAAQNQPDHVTICRFRKTHLTALEGLFTQVLELCVEAGLVSLKHVSVDGTKVRANASKRKSMTLKRMREEREHLREQVKKMLKEAEEKDAEEDREPGNQRPSWKMPPELADKQTRQKKIEEALKRLEEREQKDIAQNPARREKEPRENAQHNFTDPDSRIMPDSADKAAFHQAYNAQIAVDSTHQVIIATTLAQSPIDAPQLPEVVAEIENNLNKLPKELSADAGYASDGNLNLVKDLGIDAYVSTAKHKRDRITETAPRGRIPNNLTLVQRMTRKLTTQRGKAKYALRKQTAEPVFGQIKEARRFRRFLLRGIHGARGEWNLACIVHNLLKLFAATRRRGAAAGAT